MNKLEKFYLSMFVTLVLLFGGAILIKNAGLFIFSMTSLFWILFTYVTFDFDIEGSD